MGLLTSNDGKISLNFKAGSGPLPYNSMAKNLLCVWDIFMQDWRMINMDDCYIDNEIPNTQFWDYFNEKLRPMSADEKAQYMK
jgi:hypothetical protein